MEKGKKRLLVLGIGNYLCGDDGIGPVLAERLMGQYVDHRDVDVFFFGRLDYYRAVRRFKKRGAVISKDRTHTYVDMVGLPKLDLVKKSRSPFHTLTEIDFTVCCAAVSSLAFYHHEDFWQDLNQRKIKPVIPNSQVASRRVDKYLRRGYTCDVPFVNITDLEEIY